MGRRLAGLSDRAEAMFLEVDEANRHAPSLYLSLGFATVGRAMATMRKAAGQPAPRLSCDGCLR